MIAAGLDCSDAARAAVDRHTQAHLDGEVGGFLLGRIADGAVDVRVALPAAEAVGGRAQVTFTHADWDAAHRAVDEDHPDLRIVGWYHSHPGFGIFLSEYDRFIHANFFAEPGMVALVRDPHDGAVGWFGWRDGEITLLTGSDGVDGRSHVDSGAAPAALAVATAPGRRRGGLANGRLILGGAVVLVAGFVGGLVAGPGTPARPPAPAAADTAGDGTGDVAALRDRVDALRGQLDRLRAQRDELQRASGANNDAVDGVEPVGDAPRETGGAVIYRVRPGDTLTSLARAFYGTAAAFEQLAAANDLTDPSALDVGQELIIPDLR